MGYQGPAPKRGGHGFFQGSTKIIITIDACLAVDDTLHCLQLFLGDVNSCLFLLLAPTDVAPRMDNLPVPGRQRFCFKRA